jgi:hypothetical protein
LALVCLATGALISGTPASGAAPSATSCGKVKGNAVHVVKGQTGCEKARSVAGAYIDQAGECGQANGGQPACRVERWYCWLGSAGDQIEQNMVSFCYRPKSSGAGSSFWEPSRYKSAIKIGTIR